MRVFDTAASINDYNRKWYLEIGIIKICGIYLGVQ